MDPINLIIFLNINYHSLKRSLTKSERSPDVWLRKGSCRWCGWCRVWLQWLLCSSIWAEKTPNVGPNFVIRCGRAGGGGPPGPLCSGSGETVLITSLSLRLHSICVQYSGINQRLAMTWLHSQIERRRRSFFLSSVKMTWKKLWGFFVFGRIIICRSMTIILTENKINISNYTNLCMQQVPLSCLN